IGLSRVAAEPDSDDEVLAEILFRGQYVSAADVVVAGSVIQTIQDGLRESYECLASAPM
ncbi:hypothetical protein Tco_0440601, partial [Tanacetum coccineum]